MGFGRRRGGGVVFMGRSEEMFGDEGWEGGMEGSLSGYGIDCLIKEKGVKIIGCRKVFRARRCACVWRSGGVLIKGRCTYHVDTLLSAVYDLRCSDATQQFNSYTSPFPASNSSFFLLP